MPPVDQKHFSCKVFTSGLRRPKTAILQGRPELFIWTSFRFLSVGRKQTRRRKEDRLHQYRPTQEPKHLKIWFLRKYFRIRFSKMVIHPEKASLLIFFSKNFLPIGPVSFRSLNGFLFYTLFQKYPWWTLCTLSTSSTTSLNCWSRRSRWSEELVVLLISSIS